jgi:hypothetical protein
VALGPIGRQQKLAQRAGKIVEASPDTHDPKSLTSRLSLPNGSKIAKSDEFPMNRKLIHAAFLPSRMAEMRGFGGAFAPQFGCGSSVAQLPRFQEA